MGYLVLFVWNDSIRLLRWQRLQFTVSSEGAHQRFSMKCYSSVVHPGKQLITNVCVAIVCGTSWKYPWHISQTNFEPKNGNLTVELSSLLGELLALPSTGSGGEGAGNKASPMWRCLSVLRPGFCLRCHHEEHADWFTVKVIMRLPAKSLPCTLTGTRSLFCSVPSSFSVLFSYC